MTWAIITLQKEGLHCWHNAPSDVYFLSSPHRHVFHFEFWIEQDPNIDRDVEYISDKRKIKSIVDDYFATREEDNNLGGSCETIGNEIMLILKSTLYPLKKLKIKVMEDNENGTFIED